MNQKRNLLWSLTVQAITILLASMFAFQACNLFGAKLILLPVFIVSIYIPLKLIFHYFIYMFKELESTPFTDGVNGDTSQDVTLKENDLILLKKRMELFHYEYQQEHQQYISQKEKEENEKLCAVLKYTRDTFQQLGFDESEIFQINECVRYFVTNRKVLSIKGIRIKKRMSVTQISLKNFAWNIAFQYGLSSEATATFVIETFSEWFVNTSFETVRKNLRTTTGKHKIEINESITRF